MRLTYKAQDQYGKETGTVWYASTAGNSIFPKSDKEEQALKKLAAYEDAEEQGKLVILPCKVGDALFVTDEGTILPAVRMVESVTWWNGKISILAVNKRTGSAYRCFAEDFGKTVFLTREEAKAAMKGGQNDV